MTQTKVLEQVVAKSAKVLTFIYGLGSDSRHCIVRLRFSTWWQEQELAGVCLSQTAGLLSGAG